MKATKSVVVVYEDMARRENAVNFCDKMVRKFWDQCEFAIDWWSFALLNEPSSAKEAARKACGADLIVFACGPQSQLPSHVGAWIEHWISQRGDFEGSLASLIDPDLGVTDTHVYLRAVAHRAGMDYLTQVPQEFVDSFPDSPEPYCERACQVTGVLEEILQHHPTPPRL
jgi:hypothetical protein